MKKISLGILFLNYSLISFAQEKPADTTYLQPVEVTAIRANEKTPVAKTTLGKSAITNSNIGQDLPFILNQTPSVIVNSDAGNGIGYTGIRIRGADASRINVTLNGIPYNDAESQGTFFVDLPDIASSASSIQVQRGVGTSTNGSGAFAGSINISTNEPNLKKSIEFNNSAGSYESIKNTLVYSSGIFSKHFTFDGRFSAIRSEGYIDRASSRLSSVYGSIAWLSDKSSLRLNILNGKEKTYQAWNGIDETTLRTNRRYNSAGTDKPGTPYENEIDNYNQTHYQLFYNHKFSGNWKTGGAAFLTRGKGYYEQYKADASFGSYGLPDIIETGDTLTSTDLVRRLWLDNYFYGTTFSAQFDNSKRQVIIGGNASRYDGHHYGTLPFVAKGIVPANYHYYDLNAKKTEVSIYAKWTERLGIRWQTYADLQVRTINYKINGFRDNPTLISGDNYVFFNPKMGVTYSIQKSQLYISIAHAGKEPNRDDFESGVINRPKAEKLTDLEAGFNWKTAQASLGVNLFYMKYKDQLVLTGSVNDVGAYTRTNIPKSYRTGIELEARTKFSKYVSLGGNLTLSRNKLEGFTEYLDDYDNGGQQTQFYKNADLAFSPDIISSINLNIIPVKNVSLNFIGKYVSRQYLDNTSQVSRSLHGYYTQDIRAAYEWKGREVKNLTVFVQVMNIFSKKYEPNGYTFSYIYGGNTVTENYYYPMAPVNFVAGVNIKL